MLYRVDGTGDWKEGAVVSFSGDKAVIECKETAELFLVPIKPECLKWKIGIEGWVAMQVEAQRQAQSRSVLAGPIPPDAGFRR